MTNVIRINESKLMNAITRWVKLSYDERVAVCNDERSNGPTTKATDRKYFYCYVETRKGEAVAVFNPNIKVQYACTLLVNDCKWGYNHETKQWRRLF